MIYKYSANIMHAVCCIPGISGSGQSFNKHFSKIMPEFEYGYIYDKCDPFGTVRFAYFTLTERRDKYSMIYRAPLSAGVEYLQILDYTQFYLDLPRANEEGGAKWATEYSFLEYYGLKEITPYSLHDLADRFTQPDDSAFPK